MAFHPEQVVQYGLTAEKDKTNNKMTKEEIKKRLDRLESTLSPEEQFYKETQINSPSVIYRNLDKEKPICLFLHGTSLQNWEELDPPFNQHSNCVFASINNYKPVNEILKKIDRRIDLLWCSSPIRFDQLQQEVYNFLENKGILFTTNTLYFHTKHGNSLKGQKNIIFSDYGNRWLNSLAAFLIALGIDGWKKVYLFGADGGGNYYKTHPINDNYSNYGSEGTIVNDTALLNRDWHDIYEVAQDYLKIPYLVPDNIINVNNSSDLTCFNTIREEDFRKQFS